MNDWLHWFQVPSDPALLLWGTYDPGLVALSLGVAVFSAFMALQTAAQARALPHNLWRRLVLLSGALALGGGVWAMHFVGMLAFDLCLPVRYDPTLTLVSMLPSLAASWVALSLLTRPRLGVWELSVGGVLVGAGIGAMHYTGMAAMRMAPSLRYDATLFALSIAVAVALAMLALWVRFGLGQRQLRWPAAWVNAAASVVMGLAIAGMHYMGMAAARFVGPAATPGSDNDQLALFAVGIATIVLLFTALVVGVSAYLRQRELASALRLREEEARRLATQAEQREQDYRSLVSNLPGAVLRARVENSWPLELVSDKIEPITGCPASQLQGQPLFGGVLAPVFAEDLMALHEQLEQARVGNLNATRDYRIRRLDGRIRWVSLHVRMMRGADGTVRCMDALVFDITERKLAEMDLLQAQAIIRSSDDAIISKSTAGIITSWNQGAERIFGYSADEAIGQPIQMILPPDRVAEESDILQRIRAGQKIASFDSVRRRKDGELIDVSVTLSPIRDVQGEIIGASKIVRDISERKRNAQLQMAKDKAEQAAEARTAFLANMSHELRTPMNAVIGFTQLLLDTPLNDEQRKHLETVHQSAVTLLRLLNDILDSTKLDKGAMQLDVADFDLLALVRELEESYGLSARQKGVAFRVAAAPEVRALYRGDSLRVRQVLTNLLGNAIKFTERGEVSLSLREERSTGPLRLHFTVADTGIGIAPEQLGRIFDPFTQADASVNRRFGGTGLGTTISKQLVELMGGQIWVESTLGQGSQFHVRLPLADANSPVSAAPLPEAQVALPPLKILAVDDVPLNLKLLAMLMKKDGHEVVAAEGGAEAVQKAAEDHFDLVLMDVQMPEVNGLEATERIRQHEAEQGGDRLPIIALTASVLLSDRQAAQAAGMDGFATKPIEPRHLKAEIARVLGVWDDRVPMPQTTELPCVDEAQGLGLWSGSRDAWVQGLAFLQRDLQLQVEQIEQAVRASSAQASEHLAQLQRVARALALPMLSQCLDRLDAAVQGGNWESIYQTLAAFHAAAARTQQAIEQGGWLVTLVADSAAPLDPEAAHLCAERLRAKLLHGEWDDAPVQALRQALGTALPGGLWSLFIQALAAFDFDEALQRLDAVLQAAQSTSDLAAEVPTGAAP